MTPLAMAGLVFWSFVAGSIFVVTVIFVALKLNLKGMRKAYAGIHQGARFYGMWALTGGGVGAMYAIAIPLLDAAQIKDPWYGLILMALMLVIVTPMGLFLRGEFRRKRASV